ncbi:MAG: hypothetical protein IKN17_06185 [Ruminococcus sp.]|nr:hypothetical protein [Ruminococcus sp.]
MEKEKKAVKKEDIEEAVIALLTVGMFNCLKEEDKKNILKALREMLKKS